MVIRPVPFKLAKEVWLLVPSSRDYRSFELIEKNFSLTAGRRTRLRLPSVTDPQRIYEREEPRNRHEHALRHARGTSYCREGKVVVRTCAGRSPITMRTLGVTAT